MEAKAKIWTVGHSTRAIEAFVALLARVPIGLIVDVRQFAGSRRYPQFGQERLRASLAAAGIGYVHLPGLGGRRSKRLADSPNTAWRVEAFNAYADHMRSAAFAADFEALIAAASAQETAIMCAEALPWRCHRRLIADALILRGFEVWDVMGPGQLKPHPLTEFARAIDGIPTYPSQPLWDTPAT